MSPNKYLYECEKCKKRFSEYNIDIFQKEEYHGFTIKINKEFGSVISYGFVCDCGGEIMRLEKVN